MSSVNDIIACIECGAQTIAARPVCRLCEADAGLCQPPAVAAPAPRGHGIVAGAANPARAVDVGARAELTLKPMATAPRPVGDEHFKLLVLDEWSEGGQLTRGWALVYWLDAFDGRPAGWHERGCGDLRHPVGWVLCTRSLPIPT